LSGSPVAIQGGAVIPGSGPRRRPLDRKARKGSGALGSFQRSVRGLLRFVAWAVAVGTIGPPYLSRSTRDVPIVVDKSDKVIKFFPTGRRYLERGRERFLPGVAALV
jgi:hypothetical protein